MTLPSKKKLLAGLSLAFAVGCGGGYGGGAYNAKSAMPAGQYYPAPPAEAIAEAAPEKVGTEGFKDYGVNPFIDTKKDALSTFSIDVDTASYSFARRAMVRENRLPPYQGVRAEEFLNSFDYGYDLPDAQSKAPFKVSFAAAPSPLTQGHWLVRVGVQTKRMSAQERQPVHLVYLVDTSGSMGEPDRLPLAKRSLAMLTDTLKKGDTVALCTYAGDTRTVLEPTGIDQKQKILKAIDSLGAGGGTAMSSGIDAAYALAGRTLVKGEVNRVVVLSDGDANIGRTSHEDILKQIAQYKDKGITLSTVGFGSGNYQDTMMEQLADKGDGNYTYIDSEEQARKVFTEQVDGLLQVVARDVKIQVDLNPDVITKYRLIGYENRDIADKDFRNDKVDAGEVGAGHSVTALYDVETQATTPTAAAMTVKMRWKTGMNPQADETAFPMPANAWYGQFEQAPENYRFAVSVAGFAEVLRQSPWAANWQLAQIRAIAAESAAQKKERLELVALIDKASTLKKN